VKFFFYTAALLFPSLALSETVNGSYVYVGNPCKGERVVIDNRRLDMGHVQCTFTDRVAVTDMAAELRNADCLVEDQPEPTRYFIARHSGGLLLFSPELGIEHLDLCE